MIYFVLYWTMINDNHVSMLTFFFPFKTSFRNSIDHFRYDGIKVELYQEIIKYLPTLVLLRTVQVLLWFRLGVSWENMDKYIGLHKWKFLIYDKNSSELHKYSSHLNEFLMQYEYPIRNSFSWKVFVTTHQYLWRIRQFQIISSSLQNIK